jgi:hypothetical protein
VQLRGIAPVLLGPQCDQHLQPLYANKASISFSLLLFDLDTLLSGYVEVFCIVNAEDWQSPSGMKRTRSYLIRKPSKISGYLRCYAVESSSYPIEVNRISGVGSTRRDYRLVVEAGSRCERVAG